MKKILLWLFTLSWACLIIYLTSIPTPKVTDNDLVGLLLSSFAHFLLFGVQAVFLSLSLPTRVWRLTSDIFAILATSLYGLLIELYQRTLVGRTADPIDWILDTLGAIVFIVIIKKFLNLKS